MSTPNDNKKLTQFQRDAQAADPISSVIIAAQKKISEHKYVPRATMGDKLEAAVQPSPAAVEQALAEEKANQEKIGATVQAARAQGTREPYRAKVDYAHRCSAQDQYQDRCVMCQDHPGDHRYPYDLIDALQAQRDELLSAAQWALAFIDDGEGGEVEARTLRAAIARATEGGTGQ